MPEYGLISKVVHATALPALAVNPETGLILEANHAATVLLRESNLQHSDLYSIFPHCRTPLHQKIIEAQTHGSSQLHTIIHHGGILTFVLAIFDADPTLLLMTIHVAPHSTATLQGEISGLESMFPPIRLDAAWQLMPPRDQLHHLLAQVVARWRVEATAILLCHATHTVVIDHMGKPLAWREIPLALYAPLERSLQRGTRPCITLNDHRLRLAPLFVENNETAWGAIAFTITSATEQPSEDAALSLAALVSAVLAHAHQKHAINTHDQQRLRAVAHRDHLIRTAQRGVVLLNPAGEIEVINDFACEFLNWKREDVWQRPITNLLGTLGNLGTKLGSVLLASPRHRTELSGRIDRRNMRGRDLDVVLEPVSEEPGAYWLLLNDPTLSVMGGAVPDETSQTLGRIHQLNVTVHEMKTPLTGLVWQLAVLDDMIQKSSLPPESPIFTTLATVRQKVEQALSIMDDVKNWVSTGQKPNFDFCDLKLIAEEAIVGVEQARRGRLHRPIKIRRAFESLVPLVEGDGRRLHQMLTNLIKNAAEAITKDDGEVEVLLRPLRRDQLATYALPPEKAKVLNNGVELRVRDTGQGMTKAQLQRIFDPEVSFKLGGTGIGLWVVRTVVEQHGGEILVESDIGSGTTFTILLPQRVEGIVDS
jgi:nitrogen-specific signal transduction histidine kinase